MKKFITFMLALGVATTAFSQKAVVDQAKKLSGKSDKLEEARSLIKQAMENPETQNQANTYYIAGLIELDAFDNGFKTKMINPDDPSANGIVLGEELLSAYNYFMQALPLDSIPDEKGKVKPKVSKDIINKLKGHANDYFQAGADFYNEQKYYPEAYNAFMIYGDLPNGVMKNDATFNPQQIATSYFNAGLAASQGGNPEAAAEAFKAARLAGYEQPEATIYEIASWQTIVQQDENRASEGQQHIMEAAQFGIETFGIDNPIFINNLINSLVNDGRQQEALNTLAELINANPSSSNLYGLRGYVYENLENDDLSEADYRKGAELATQNSDFETLKNASSKLYRIGAAKLNALEGNSPEINAERENIRENYFIAAQNFANQANQIQPGDSFIQNILDSIDYALTTFFNN